MVFLEEGCTTVEKISRRNEGMRNLFFSNEEKDTALHMDEQNQEED